MTVTRGSQGNCVLAHLGSSRDGGTRQVWGSDLQRGPNEMGSHTPTQGLGGGLSCRQKDRPTLWLPWQNRGLQGRVMGKLTM